MAWRDRGVSLALVLVEGLWAYAALAIVGTLFGFAGSPVGFVPVLLMLISAFVVGQRLNEVDAPGASRQAAGAAIGVALIFIAMGFQLAKGDTPFDATWPISLVQGAGNFFGALVALAAFVILYWRGTRLALGDDPKETLRTSFGIGILAMAALTIADAAYGRSLEALLVLFPFFGAALAGLALANIEGQEERREFSARDWLRVALVTIGGILLLGALVSLVASDQVGHIVSAGMSVVGGVLDRVFYVVFLLLGYVLQLMIDFAFMILRWIGAHPEPLQINTDTGSLVEKLQQGPQQVNSVVVLILAILKWAFVAGLIGGVLVWLGKAFLFRNSRSIAGANEVRESVWKEGALQDDLSALLAKLWSNVAGRRKLAPLRWDVASRDEGIGLAYGLYLHLLELARGAGLERQPFQTPAEFQPTLVERFPTDAVTQITRTFEKARYGLMGPDREEIDRLRLAWAAVQAPRPEGQGTGEKR